MNETHLTGAKSELLVSYKLTERGYSVFFPLLTQSDVDLVALKGSETLRVQVKTASKIKVEDKYYLQARLQSRGSGNGYIRTYDKDAFDYVAFVYKEKVWLYPWEPICENKSITLGRLEGNILKPKRNGVKINWSKYEL